MCDTCRGRKTHIDVDCIDYDKFNQPITDLHESIGTNAQALKAVEGERGSVTYLIQQMNSDLIKFKVKVIV